MDIQAAVAQRTGVGRYTASLAAHAGAYIGHDLFTLFFFDFKRKGLPVECPHAKLRANRLLPGRIVQKAWKTWRWPPYNWFAGPADVYHFPNFILPPLTAGRSVVTIHDLAFVRFPETIEARNLKYLRTHMAYTVKHADALIAVSEFTARELHDVFNVPRKKISVIHEGLDAGRFQTTPAQVTDFRRRYQLQAPYLLTVGTLEPRKNIPFLIKVFETLPHNNRQLVIAGMRGWKDDPILQQLRQSPCANRIRYLDYIPEPDLPALYSGADLFVFPSLYEGFGFTPLEAMACGTPVVSSNTGSLPEVLGDAACIVEGFETEPWHVTLDSLLQDRTRLQQYADQGRKQVTRFSWDTCARQTWDLYRKVAAA
jgi:glycosyltransferase involved in cell wall biosynthesis